MAARSSALVARWVRHALQHWGWERISLSVCWPCAVISADFMRCVRFRLHYRDLYSRLFQRAQIRLWDLLVGNHFMDRRDRHDVAQAATAELTRVAYRDRPAGNFDHSPVDFGL